MKKTKGFPTVWIPVVGLLLLGAGELAMWAFSGYEPLLTLALLQLLPGVVNLLLLLPLGKHREEKPEVSREERKWKAVLRRVGRWLATLFRALGNFWHDKWSGVIALLLLAAIFVGNLFFWPHVSCATETAGLAYWIPVGLVVAFVISVALEKFCAYAEADGRTGKRMAAIVKNLRSAMVLGRVGQILAAVAMVLTLTGLYDPQIFLRIALSVLFVYETVLLALSVAIRLIRHELAVEPALPLSVKAMGSSGVIAYLEENTGITMRSLWSIQLIRQILPGVALFVVLLCWLASGIIQIDAHQEGALYRLGKLQPETLQPGIHMTLPWPFDKVEVYDTQSLRKVVIGYIPNGSEDNTWTGGHGTEEYRLLLGGGNEMVSINLQVEYQISDLNRFIQTSASAESLLSAAAYEIVTERTISTDIDTLLSADRTVFSQTFQEELEERMEAYDLGIRVTNVVLESIHPPVEVAWIYQEVISAGIRAKEKILAAEGSANMKIAWSHEQANSETSMATNSYYQQVAAAKGEVAEFMAALEAYESQPAAYTYYKYINALTQAYRQGVLILVGDGVDEGALVIGALERPLELTPGYLDESYEEEDWEDH